MLKPNQELDLALKASPRRSIRGIDRVEDFQRDIAFQLVIERFVDLSHTASTKESRTWYGLTAYR